MPNKIEKLAVLLEQTIAKVARLGCPRSDARRMAADLIANGVTVQQWIPVTEGTPVDDAALHFQQFGEYPEYIVMIAGGLFATTLFFDG